MIEVASNLSIKYMEWPIEHIKNNYNQVLRIVMAAFVVMKDIRFGDDYWDAM